jgi:hypothetical protein
MGVALALCVRRRKKNPNQRHVLPLSRCWNIIARHFFMYDRVVKSALKEMNEICDELLAAASPLLLCPLSSKEARQHQLSLAASTENEHRSLTFLISRFSGACMCACAGRAEP